MGVTTSAERQLGPYVLLAVGGLVAALVTGQPALVAPAAAGAVLVAVALRDRRAVAVELVSVDAPERVLEGDRWTLTIRLRWAGEAELDIIHTGLKGSVIDGPSGWQLRATDGAIVTLEADAERWGRHLLGTLDVRARRPGAMLRFDRRIDLPDAVRILPGRSRLDELFHPRTPRVAAGGHIAPIRGPGTDFADLRPYVPGDRLRDVSWSASARGDQPWVVVHHPERTGTVVLLLDAFTEVGAAGAVDRAARVVWTIARQHLIDGDRVGLVATGTSLAWLPPVSGRRARLQVLDALLAVGSDLAGSPRDGATRDARRAPLPADAIVVGVSPLQSDAFIAEVLHHVRLGRPAMVVGIETADLLEEPDGPVETAARRLWAIEVTVRRSKLSRAGVPSAMVVDDGAKAVRLLSRRQPRRLRPAIRSGRSARQAVGR